MTEEFFEDVLRSINLPYGELLNDGKTYLVLKKNHPEVFIGEISGSFEKFLVLSDGNLHVVGGVAFYGNWDIQMQVFDEYQGCGYLSAICHNGILKRECYKNQQATISVEKLDNFDDFKKRYHLLGLIGAKVRNLSEVWQTLETFNMVPNSYTKENFFQEFPEISDSHR